MMSTIATCVYFGCWKVRRARSSSAARPFAGASSNRLVRHPCEPLDISFFLCVKDSTPLDLYQRGGAEADAGTGTRSTTRKRIGIALSLDAVKGVPPIGSSRTELGSYLST